MAERVHVSQAVEAEDEWSESQLSDHSYTSQTSSQSTSRNYYVLQPVTQPHDVVAATMNESKYVVFAGVSESGEVKSSIEEQGGIPASEDVKPQLTELAIAGSQERHNYLVQQDISQAGIKVEDGAYQTGMEQKDLVVALIHVHIPIENVPYNITHAELVKALSTQTDKVSVRTMRRSLPCLRIVAYLNKTEFVGKKKIKGLWNVRPDDWPHEVPYKDPNNGEKINGRAIPKANSGELRRMFDFLKKKFMRNIQDEISHMSEEEIDLLPKPPPMSFDVPRRAVKRHASSAGAHALPESLVHQEIPTFVQDEEVFHNIKQSHYPEDGLDDDISAPTQADDYNYTHNNDSDDDIVDDDVKPPASSLQRNDVTSQAQPLPQQPPKDGLYVVHHNDGVLFVMNNEKRPVAQQQLPHDKTIIEAATELLDIYRKQQQLLQVVRLDDNGRVKSYEPLAKAYEQMGKGRGNQLTNNHDESQDQGYAIKKAMPGYNASSSREGTVLQRESSAQPPAEPVVVTPSVTSGAYTVQSPRPLTTPLTVAMQRQESIVSLAHLRQTPLTVAEKESPIVTAQQPSSHTITPYVTMASSAQPSASSAGVYGQSMYSVMQSQQAFQAPGTYNMRTTILTDLFQRLKEKIMYLQNITLGDEQISASLSRLYQMVIMQHFTRAQMDSTKTEAFIHAAHKCESLMDKAMLDGKNIPRQIFLDDCRNITDEFGNPHEKAVDQKYVFPVKMPDHPNIQLTSYLKTINQKFSDANPIADLSPPSPFSLGQKFQDMNLQSPSSDRNDFATSVANGNMPDLAQLGIKQKKKGSLTDVFETRPLVNQPSSEDSVSSVKDGVKNNNVTDPTQLLQLIEKYITDNGIPIEAGDANLSTSEKLTQKLLAIEPVGPPTTLTPHPQPLTLKSDLDPSMTVTPDVNKLPGLLLAQSEAVDPVNQSDMLEGVLDLEEMFDANTLQPSAKNNASHLYPQAAASAASAESAANVSLITKASLNQLMMNRNTSNNVVDAVRASNTSNTPLPSNNHNNSTSTPFTRTDAPRHVGKARNHAQRPHGKAPIYMRGKEVRWSKATKTIGKTVCEGGTNAEDTGSVGAIAAPLPLSVVAQMETDENGIDDESRPKYMYENRNRPPDKHNKR